MKLKTSFLIAVGGAVAGAYAVSKFKDWREQKEIDRQWKAVSARMDDLTPPYDHLAYIREKLAPITNHIPLPPIVERSAGITLH